MPDTPLVLPRRSTRRSFLDRGLRLGLSVTGGVTLASLLDACATGSGGTAPTPPPGAPVIRALLFDQVGYDNTVLQALANKFRSRHDNKVFVSIETAHYRATTLYGHASPGLRRHGVRLPAPQGDLRPVLRAGDARHPLLHRLPAARRPPLRCCWALTPTPDSRARLRLLSRPRLKK